MFMKLLSCILGSWLVPSIAFAAIEIVSIDGSVDSHPLFADTTDLNEAGLLFVGNVGSEVARSYLQFNLPAFIAGTQIVSAKLSGTYSYDYDDSTDDGTFSWYFAANNLWDESNLTWNNQPGTTGSSIASWDSTAAINNTIYEWDITSVVNQLYQADAGIMSLVFRSDNEASASNFQYWWSREGASESLEDFQPFQLEFIVEENTAVVPELTSLTIWGIIGTGSLVGSWRRRRV